MKRAFTLIELLVVIGILGILIGILAASFSGSTDKARTVKCATNLKNLAAAAIALAPHYPYAQSALYIDTDTSREGEGVCYRVHKGWISFLDRGTTYPLADIGEFTQCSFAGGDDRRNVEYAITNGAIWQAVGCNRSTYVCPEFLKACRKVGVNNPGWSYQMSAYFGYETEKGKAMATEHDYIKLPSRADRRLMFAEIQALVPKAGESGVSALPEVDLSGDNGTPECDSCLRYKSKGGNESIGFNHRRGRDIIGHVAFADGHVEAIVAPKDGNFVELTDWLCEAKDIVYHDGSYEDIKGTEVE